MNIRHIDNLQIHERIDRFRIQSLKELNLNINNKNSTTGFYYHILIVSLLSKQTKAAVIPSCYFLSFILWYNPFEGGERDW